MNKYCRMILLSLLIFVQIALLGTCLSCSKPPAGILALNHPESVVYDRSHARYLVSNVAGKNIIAIDKEGKLTLFSGDLAGPKGMTVKDNEVYVADVNSVRAFSLITGAQSWFLPLPDSKFLNDTAMDNSHYLFVSDMNDNCIYRIDVDTQKYDIFRDGALIKPNGLCYDVPNHRLIIVSQRHRSPIQALDWDTQKLVMIKNTDLSGCDGITRDISGNYFITSWDAKGVFKYPSDFSGEPFLLKDGLKGPADISYNPDSNKLAVPVMMENRIEFMETW